MAAPCDRDPELAAKVKAAGIWEASHTLAIAGVAAMAEAKRRHQLPASATFAIAIMAVADIKDYQRSVGLSRIEAVADFVHLLEAALEADDRKDAADALRDLLGDADHVA